MKRCLVGVVSWCDSVRFPHRFKIFKDAVKSIDKFIPRDICTLAIVDNNSTEDVQKYIEKQTIFDIKVLLPENIHDVGAYGVLAEIAKDSKLPYMWLLENDYVLFRKNFLSESIKFLETNPDIGYVRMQKFEYANQKKYDKSHKEKSKVDKENAVWLKNIESNKSLVWSKVKANKLNKYYKNNWHFGLHGGLIKTEIWSKIYPEVRGKMPYYYKLEASMRQRYQKLRLNCGVLDGGAFAMKSDTVYQQQLFPSLLKKLTKSLPLNKGDYGGYVDSRIISYYKKNYQNFAPVKIQLFSNSLGDDEIKSLRTVFASHWLGYGNKSREFETKFASMLGSKYALGISSCTAGLFMSMEMLGIHKDDEIIIPTVGFIGCANAVVKAGAKPVFADVDDKYFNILPSEIERLLSPRTKAVMVLHYGGIACEVNAIKKIIKKSRHKIYLIEDSANSIKSLYHNEYCGTLGDIGLFSLDANKIITTGTGGVLTTNNDELYLKAKTMRFYGLKPDLSTGYDALRARKERWWEIDLEYHGNRYITNDIISAIALEQMQKLDSYITKRRKISLYYTKKLKQIQGITTPKLPPKNTTSSYYFYWIQVENSKKQLSLAHFLVKNGIYTTFRYYPLHLINYYKSHEKLPQSELISQTTLNLPLHQNLTQHEIDRVIETVASWSKLRN